MKYLKNYGASAEEYVVRKMKIRLLRLERMLKEHTEKGNISWCVFNKEEFEKKLGKKVKKLYGKKIKLDSLWKDAISSLDLYVQADFLENSYGYKFKMFGDYRDFGFVIFCGNDTKSNPTCAKELICEWFDEALFESYKKEVKRYNSFFNFSSKPFSFAFRWNPVYRAAAHFDSDFSKENAKDYLLALIELYGLSVKHIDDYEVELW